MLEVFKGHYQITRHAHLAHLTRIMPLIALIYGSQIILMPNLASEFVTESLFFTGICLVAFLGYFYFFDHYQKTIITPEKIILEFHPFFEQKAINITEIMAAEVIDPEASFSTIILKLKSGAEISLYFVDRPVEVHTIIQNYLSSHSEPFDLAS